MAAKTCVVLSIQWLEKHHITIKATRETSQQWDPSAYLSCSPVPLIGRDLCLGPGRSRALDGRLL